MQPKTLDTLFLPDQRRPTTRPPVARRPPQTRQPVAPRRPTTRLKTARRPQPIRQSTEPRRWAKTLATARRLPQRIPLTKPKRSVPRSQANPIHSNIAKSYTSSDLKPQAAGNEA